MLAFGSTILSMGTTIEEGYPGQQGSDDAQQRCIRQQNQHEKHEWENQTECES
jgi:hypothetical protein